MRSTRRLTASVAVTTLVAAALTGCTSGDDDAGGDATIVIGADLAVNSLVDKAYGNALQLKVDQVNKSGVLGNRTLQLRIADNRNNPTDSLRNISAFADDPAVAAVVAGACSECVEQSAKAINGRKIPTIALAAADEVSSPVADRRYIFKIGPNVADSSAALIDELERVKTTTVAVLHTEDLYGNAGKTAMTTGLKAAGIDLTTMAGVRPGATDITQTVGTLTDSKPQALVVLAGPEQAALAATSAKRAGFTGKLYFDAAAAADMFIPQESAGATEQTTMVFTQILAIDDIIATTPAKASRKQWFRDYTSQFGGFSGVAAFAADAAELIASAVVRVGADRDAVRDILETSQFDGLSGPIRLTPDNHSGLMPQALTMLVARAGRWRIAS